MIRTYIASGLAILLAFGTTLQQVAARSGFARAGSFHHSVAPTIRPVGHPAHAHFSSKQRGLHRFAFRRHGHGLVGWGFPFGYVGTDGSYYDVTEGAAVYGNLDAAEYDTPYQTMAVIGPPRDAHACRSQAQWVPGTHGLTRVVVTRC